MYSTIILSLGICLPGQLPDAPGPVREKGFAATVRITNPETGKFGTGVVLGVQGDYVHILTAAHLVTRDSRPRVETFAPGKTSVAAILHDSCEVVARVSVSDLAVIRLPVGKHIWSAVPVAKPSELPAHLERAWAIGCDDGEGPRLESIAITGRKQVKQPGSVSPFFWEAKEKTVAGRSGGPLLDEKGRLIGICSGTQEGFSYYVHLDEIRSALQNNHLERYLGESADR